MTTPACAVSRPASRVGVTAVSLLALAVLAGTGSIAYARQMGDGPGTSGMALGPFLAMWTSMMAAMMLPAIVPVVSGFTRTVATDRAVRTALFVGGYLVVWSAVGVPVYGALRVVDRVVGDSGPMMRSVAVGILIAAGLYQLSSDKARRLDHCRSALAHVSCDDAGDRNRIRDLESGVRCGLACLVCCWALTALLVAFGVMNVWAMAVLAAVVVGERLLPHGKAIGAWAGAACLLLAVLMMSSPRTAGALLPSAHVPSTGTMPGMTMTDT